MYWRQIAVAVLLGISAGYLLWTEGVSPSVSAAVAILVYFAVRWFIAWAFRVRYWYRRGTRGVYTRSCPDCGQYIYRKSGDWVIKCHRCGWTAGLPIIRWLTNSVPSIQLRRTVGGPQLLAVVLAVGVVVAGGIPAGYLAYDGQIDAGNTDDGTKSNEITTETEAEDDLKIEEIERLILKYTNKERNRRGLSKVDYAPRMVSIAREHSANMARNDYMGHTKPSGETGEDRYESVCDYTGSGYLFGENVASAWHERNLKRWDSDGTVYLETEEEIAEYLVTGWMGSKGHRENILNPSWEEMVAGIYVTDDGKVYATQNFC